MALLDPRTWFRREPSSTALALRADTSLSAPPAVRPITRDRRYGSASEDPARYGDLEKVAGHLQRCFNGDVSGYIDACKSVRRYDGWLNSVCAKRVLAISGRRWALKPPPGFEGDREALANCAFVTAQLNDTKGFATKLGHLGHAVLEGHAGLQHVWYRNLRGEIATQPREVHPRLFGWDVATGEAGISLDGRTGSAARLTPLIACPNEFVFHNPVGGTADDPWLRGALRCRLLASLTKRMGIRWWLKLLERWGQPQVVATKGGEGPDDGEDADNRILRALREMGTDWRAVVPPGTTITTIPNDVKSDLHATWVKKCDDDDSIAILGQNLSTSVQGGSFAAARAHAWVLATILEADLAELSETITDQWIEPIVRFNRPGSPVPWLYINPAPQSELTKDDLGLVDSKGRRIFSAAEYRASKGYDLRPVDAEGEDIEVEVVVDEAPAGALDAGPKMDEVAKAIDMLRGNGLQPTAASMTALVADLGLVTEPIPDGVAQPKAIPLAPTDLAKVVKVDEARGSVGLSPFNDERDALTINELDAKIAAAAEEAKIAAAAQAEAAKAAADAALAAPVVTSESPAPSTTPIVVGDIWTDTVDAHRLRVERIEGSKVYLTDLDAEPNQHGQQPQFAWAESAFRERCRPPTPE